MNTVQTDVSGEREICQTLIEAVADAEELKPTELSPPLYEVIDPDALETVFDTDRALGKIVFNYNSCEVSVFSDGYVSVTSHGA